LLFLPILTAQEGLWQHRLTSRPVQASAGLRCSSTIGVREKGSLNDHGDAKVKNYEATRRNGTRRKSDGGTRDKRA
jgi:hypothetical protein